MYDSQPEPKSGAKQGRPFDPAALEPDPGADQWNADGAEEQWHDDFPTPPVPKAPESGGKTETVDAEAIKTFARNVRMLLEPLQRAQENLSTVSILPGAFPHAVALHHKVMGGGSEAGAVVPTTVEFLKSALAQLQEVASQADATARDYSETERNALAEAQKMGGNASIAALEGFAGAATAGQGSLSSGLIPTSGSSGSVTPQTSSGAGSGTVTQVVGPNGAPAWVEQRGDLKRMTTTPPPEAQGTIRASATPAPDAGSGTVTQVVGPNGAPAWVEQRGDLKRMTTTPPPGFDAMTPDPGVSSPGLTLPVMSPVEGLSGVPLQTGSGDVSVDQQGELRAMHTDAPAAESSVGMMTPTMPVDQPAMVQSGTPPLQSGSGEVLPGQPSGADVPLETYSRGVDENGNPYTAMRRPDGTGWNRADPSPTDPQGNALLATSGSPNESESRVHMLTPATPEPAVVHLGTPTTPQSGSDSVSVDQQGPLRAMHTATTGSGEEVKALRTLVAQPGVVHLGEPTPQSGSPVQEESDV